MFIYRVSFSESMTIGLYFANKKEAVVLIDKRVSTGTMGSDSGEALALFTQKRFHGVMIGAGEYDPLVGILQYTASLKEQNSLDSFVEKIAKGCKSMRKKQPPNPDAAFFLVAYDKDAGIQRMYSLETEGEKSKKPKREIHKKELFDYCNSFGSGGESAQPYYMGKLNGLALSTLNLSDLVFFAINSYSWATVNEGVGGVPAIAHLSEQEVHLLSREQSIALANLSGAFLSENNPALREKDMVQYIEQILSEKEPAYDQIAEILGVDRNTLVSLYVPYSSWQERANYRIFAEGKKIK